MLVSLNSVRFLQTKVGLLGLLPPARNAENEAVHHVPGEPIRPGLNGRLNVQGWNESGCWLTRTTM